MLYGDQENQYILDLLAKKARKVHPELQNLILEEVKKAGTVDAQSLNSALDLFLATLIPPTEKDQFSFKSIDEDEHLYIGFTDYGKKPQIYLKQDQKKKVLHIIPFTFSAFPMDRLMVYLSNEESLAYFSEEIDTDILEEFIILYSASSDDNGIRLYPLSYDRDSEVYEFKEDNVQKMDGNLYLPFLTEIEKEKLLNEKYSKEN